MHSNAARKEAIREFKERKPFRGTFAVRCMATGQVWVGSSMNLDATKNRFWFCLRNGSHPDDTLQNEWNVHGERTFHYEILEKLTDDLLPLGVADLLKEKRIYWIAQLDAKPL